MKTSWDNDSLQFARLIGEMASTIELDIGQEEALCASMDLTPDELHEIFDRGQARWDRIKHNTGPDGYQVPIDGYNDDMDPAVQVEAEEYIAGVIFYATDDRPSEESCADLGRTILAVILHKFRPDLYERPLDAN